MLSMVIFTFKPENREAVLKRRAEENAIFDFRIIGEWFSADANRVFRLIEGGNLHTALEAYRTWGHLGNIEVFPLEKVSGIMQYPA